MSKRPEKLFAAFMFSVLMSSVSWGVPAASGFSNHYALVIGISDYPNAGMNPLPNAYRDAISMTEYLRGQGYQVRTLTNNQATKANIVSYLVDELAPRVGENDRFLFFFSGHGVTRHVGGKDRGYIIPADGKENSAASWVSMSNLRDFADQLGNARHQLFIFDSCFGGSFVVKSLATSISPSTLNYIDRITKATARQYITAGGANEQVTAGGKNGNSLFTYQLLKGLNGAADSTVDGFITASEIAAYMQTAATTAHSTPVAGNFRGHENGDYLFRSPLQATIRHNNNAWSGGQTKSAESNPFVTDPNGKRYSVIALAGKSWLQTNLDYPTGNSWCYENKFRNCTDYGRLYDWHAAKQACEALGNGWRLPSDADWRALADAFGGYNNAQQENRDTRMTQVALSPGGESGFNLQYGGGRYPSDTNPFGYINAHGKYWSSTRIDDHSAWYMAFVGQVERYPDPMGYGYSVRCLKD